MNRRLNHLPDIKQAHIRTIVEIIHDEFDQVVNGATTTTKANSRIMLIILFGSYATGAYVDDPSSGYISDYDILVVLNEPELADEYKIWHTVEERAHIKTGSPVNLVVCTLREINRELKQGHYFFKDIREQGIQLYQHNHAELLTPGPLNEQEAKRIAKEHFDQWFTSGNEFLDLSQTAIGKSYYKNAAFLLHQAVECYFSCILLVYTNYRPKTHNIKALDSLAVQQVEKTKQIFPQTTKQHRSSFQQLKKAYIEARYSKNYAITVDALAWLSQRAAALQQLTERCCADKMA